MFYLKKNQIVPSDYYLLVFSDEEKACDFFNASDINDKEHIEENVPSNSENEKYREKGYIFWNHLFVAKFVAKVRDPGTAAARQSMLNLVKLHPNDKTNIAGKRVSMFVTICLYHDKIIGNQYGTSMEIRDPKIRGKPSRLCFWLRCPSF
ncbi:hypothetical protein AVEN_194603-1 [Araneus ventricosus]|uniref:Uncharacterized protein n=1 Tax=Araneus ventricosus TaxID=182803 RepID=A0A4Y2A915_ARAVE|nr:hypothetical protein AVEN_194603-1 [Araneus ventricosus]